MVNLLLKDLKLGVRPIFIMMPLLTGVLMLIPGWIYLIIPFYFCWITVPNMFAGFRIQNDLLLTAMLPVARQDAVRARVSVMVILEGLHIVFALLVGLINLRLYPNFMYYFFAPSLGLWGIALVMLGIFNLVFLPMYYKTAYKYGGATTAAIAAAMLFAVLAQWLGIRSAAVADAINGAGADDRAVQAAILIAGVAIFAALTWIACRIAIIRFLKVEIE